MAQNYVLLETIHLSQTTSSITFDNIPQTGYTDLKLVMSTRGTYSSGTYYEHIRLTFNTGSNYKSKLIYANGSQALSADDSGGASTYAPWAGVFVGSNATSNTFSDTEIYIPDYSRSGVQKSFLSNSVSESNHTSNTATTAVAQLWSGTDAISSITIYPSVGSFVAESTFSLYGLATVGTTPVTAPFATGGNIVANDGTYWYHAFLSSGTFTPLKALSCDMLVVAGGGAGGAGHAGGAGGGGAGGLLGFTSQTLTSGTSYTCTVGAGGAAQTSVNGGAVFVGNNGSNSVFQGLTAAVGGGGGAATATNAANIQGNTGGSGGGTAFWNASTLVAGGQGTSGQGYSAGQVQGPGYTRGASGGGGAGAASGDIGAANSYDSTAGGIGATFNTSVGGTAGPYSFINAMAVATNTGVLSSNNYYYAGGGGGAGGGSAKAGGIGGGGAAYSTSTTGTATSGTRNTGGGGGGASADASGIYSFTSGSGGSGIVIVRYPMV